LPNSAPPLLINSVANKLLKTISCLVVLKKTKRFMYTTNVTYSTHTHAHTHPHTHTYMIFV